MSATWLVRALLVLALTDILIVLSSPSVVFGANFFVATTGSDSALGTAAAPWRTLQHAAETVAAGDRVTVRPGNYVGFHLETSGTSANPICFSADPRVLIYARNPVTPDGINLEGASFVVVDGFEVAGMPRAGVRSVGHEDDFAEFVTVRNVYAHDNGVWGIFTGHVDDLLIESNRTSGSLDEHGIYVSNSGDRPVVRNNVSWNNRGSGIQLNADAELGGDGIITDALISDNRIFNNGSGGGSGINLDGVQDSLIQNNLLYNNRASGISLFRINGAEPSTGNLVVGNTIHQSASGRWALNIQHESTGNSAFNNILVSSHSFRGAIDICPDCLAGFESDYNVVISRFTTTEGDSIIDLEDWTALTGNDANSIVANNAATLFAYAAAGNYQLAENSPARNAGTEAEAPNFDLLGHPRPYDAGFDIGALERILPGDFNADGRVGAADFTIWRDSLGSQVYFGAGADGNMDGQVTTADFELWKSNYGKVASGSASAFPLPPSPMSAVPEPATAALILLSALFAIRRRSVPLRGLMMRSKFSLD